MGQRLFDPAVFEAVHWISAATAAFKQFVVRKRCIVNVKRKVGGGACAAKALFMPRVAVA